MGLFAGSSSGTKQPNSSGTRQPDKAAQMAQMNKEWQSLQMMAKQAKDKKF